MNYINVDLCVTKKYILGGFKVKCPYCGEEMHKGLVQSGRDIFWSPKKRRCSLYLFHQMIYLLLVVLTVLLENHIFVRTVKR